MKYTTSQHTNPYILATDSEELDFGKKGSDRIILAAIITLMMAGLLAVFSSIAYFAEMKSTSAGTLLMGHTIKMGIAFIVMILFSKIDYRTILKFSRVALIISWILLLAVILFGNEVFGAKRWLTIGSFSFQPSSLASIALLCHIVVLVESKQDYIKDFQRSFLPIMFWILITCTLIGIEDFSTAGVLMVISVILLVVGRSSVVQISGLFLVALLGGSLLIYSSPERQSRINNFVEQVIEIKADTFALNEGYQSQQAHIAFARGEYMGVGIGKSSQRNFLPAPYNDFIFAIIGEEYGLFGAIFIISIYIVILLRGFVFVARKAEDYSGTLLAVASTLFITIYAFVNAAVATGLFPVTGLPMPFVSYGGTSMLFSGIMAGILLNISKNKRR